MAAGRVSEAGEDVATPDAWAASPLGAFPGGLEVGTFVHAVLERVDFAAPELSVELDAAMRAVQARGSDVDGDLAILGDGLVKALSTPLGPLLPGVCLRDVARKDRLDELGFELPLAGGDSPLGYVSTADLAAVLDEHLPADGVLAGYPQRLSDPLLETTVRGYLTGSLDLVFRRSFADGLQRWFVADYKTNWLGEGGRALTAWHYRPEALDAEMQRRHYPLQALIYLVALHRYLRWRLPGYSPHMHLGGTLYLFVRGMVGTNTPVVDGQTCGVFSWAPPAELIVDLSELFERGRSSG
jgi:exodeoxyribonuclease V beta subunit